MTESLVQQDKHARISDSTSANRLARHRRNGRLSAVAAATLLLFALATPQRAQACSHFNPVCWVEEAIDIFQDLLEGMAMLVLDVIELDPGEFFDDLTDIAEDFIFCDGAGFPEATYVEFLIYEEGADIAEHLFDDCDASDPIEPDVLAKLGTYFRSDLSSVRIHKNCDFEVGGRLAITFGENIYFNSGQYYPTCAGPDSCTCRGGMDVNGFSLLAHELVHVLQYRSEGFKDFICMYFLECGAGQLIGLSCPFEQQAFIYEALVLEDMQRDGDGVFTCPLGVCDDDIHEWNYANVPNHSCVAEIQLCGALAGDPSAPDYCALNDNCPDVYNPDQADSDGDGRGDACDYCDGTLLPYEDLDDDCVPDTVDNCACPSTQVAALGDCDPTNDIILPAPPGHCFGLTGCAAFSNPDQADFDMDGIGDVCDPDDDNDGLDDVFELAGCTDPKNPDTDGDGLTDGDEVHTYMTNPCDADTDDDTLTDGEEVNDFGTNPLDPDTDDDGLRDDIEVHNGTDPNNPDSDGDGIVDGEDVEFLQYAITHLPGNAFRQPSNGNRTAMLVALDAIEVLIHRGKISQALIQLNNLRARVNGCGATPDGNDWIIDCPAQLQIRSLLDVLIANLAN